MRVRSRLLRTSAAALAGGLIAGCVYYNGMYNTNRLMRSAQKAERENKPFEASNLWGQVVTRAESVAVRHPHSKYAAQANVVRGLALSRLNQCQKAIPPLGQVALLPPGDLAEEGTLALGHCQMELGDPAGAELAFTQVVRSRNAARRREARFQHARALRMTGHYEEAIPLLQEAKGSRAAEELLLSFSGAGRDAEADSLAAVMLASGDTTRVWDSLVVALGRQRPGSAVTLLDRLAAQPNTAAAVRAKRLYDEGVRLEPVDTLRALARLQQAVRVGGKTEAAEQAALHLLRRGIARAGNVEALAPLADSLRVISSRPVGAGLEAAQLVATMTRVRVANDSGGADVPKGDMRLFLAAESARDTLGAPGVAARLFHRIVAEWPESPYAPKAVLAGAALDSAWADSAQILLAERYGDSPYLAILRGESTEEYRVLEDSLLAFASTQPAGRPLRPGVRPGQVRPGRPALPRRRTVDPDVVKEQSGGRRVEQ